MELHVSGGTASLSLGAMRCDLLAVLIGNHLFTKEEQLRANHHVHECEDPRRLALWLHNVEQEAERRERAATLATQEAKRIAYCGSDAPAAELRYLAKCHVLSEGERLAAKIATPELTLAMVGYLYVKALKRHGKLCEDIYTA